MRFLQRATTGPKTVCLVCHAEKAKIVELSEKPETAEEVTKWLTEYGLAYEPVKEFTLLGFYDLQETKAKVPEAKKPKPVSPAPAVQDII